MRFLMECIQSKARRLWRVQYSGKPTILIGS